MNASVVPPNSVSSIFKFGVTPFPLYSRPTLHCLNPGFFPSSHHLCSLPLFPCPNFKMKVNGAMGLDDYSGLLEDECVGMVVETCLTQTLPPALTLEHGLNSLKMALHELKLNPPTCTTGMIRFEVAVPPSAKALAWFSCQPESSGVFPQFYISKELENPYGESASMSMNNGVFGVGAAVDFRQFSSSSGDWNSFRRYLLVDSLNITAYGFIGINYDAKSSLMKRETGSLYFIIPQIELKENDGFSMLVGTLIWHDSFLCNFEQALNSFEVSLAQATDNIPPTLENCHSSFDESSVQKFNVVEHEKLESIYMEASLLGRCDNASESVEMKNASTSSQFCIRFSPKAAVSTDMQLSHAGVTSSSLQESANINTVWASLIVEECVRLGLTYFCVAPGSRSSPLAIAASSHPRVTCIACYDERSLAFHAVGYARGSHKPAVVITTSGTAVSNLYPAVVEASQDFVPLVLFTADRPSELQATGANQAIDQVNHFGSYARFFFNLPTPTDDVTTRMVLSTVDSAVYWATCSPYGPVQVNCPFREPLENSRKSWERSALDGLKFWISSTQPFTKYIQVQSSFTENSSSSLTADVEKVIQGGRSGLLIVGAIRREDEIWATLLLAKHLSWPVVADILSGIRIRKLLVSFPEYENIVFLDHFDHMLLCDSIRQWVAQLDVILQVGSKITSKRVANMLEQCFPCTYIMVDKHPCRHDPSHIVTHRIQSTISQFTSSLLKSTSPCMGSKWNSFLRALNFMVAWELSFQIRSEPSLTEPHVAHALSEALTSETALFFGNSMPIRDADMYAPGMINWKGAASQLPLPCTSIIVAGNRGASGIDGLLSTTTGFAVGCRKRVLCIIGDVSFLHDTNGLAIFSSRMWPKPITVVVINNRGGGIFSFLPIAEKTEPQILEKYFYYQHGISISKLCAAHGLKHMLAETKMELQQALLTSKQMNTDCVIEVASAIDSNTTFHSILKKYASQAASHAFTTLSQLSIPESVQEGFFLSKIVKLEYYVYRLNLNAPPTSVAVDGRQSNFVRQGFILQLTLDDGSTGFGEIAPLGNQKESVEDVEDQIRFLLHVLKGAAVTYLLPLLKGSFSSWIRSVIGVSPCSILPSVRCGVEMAILNAIATRQNCTLLDILLPQSDKACLSIERPNSIDICALVDSEGNPAEVANVVSGLVEEGFRAVKLKVARRDDPKTDAAVIREIRRMVGSQIELRVDANRKWSYEDAIEFSSLVKDCNLQYIEEPVQSEEDILKFCEETSMPVALDETVDYIQGNILDFLARFSHPGIVALVIKPTFVGGFENTAIISSWAHSKGKLAVVSAAFESSLSLSSYVQFACYLEMKRAEICQALDMKPEECAAHGLGTYKWLKDDVTPDPLVISRQECSTYMGAPTDAAGHILQNFHINHKVISQKFSDQHISTYQHVVELQHFSYLVQVQETGESKENNVLLFLHGFMGTSEDWIPVMKALSGSAKCISIDLPGHGRSKMQSSGDVGAARNMRLSMEVVVAILDKLISKITPGKVILIGYSMGARIAIYMALRLNDKISGAIVISGSPGLIDVKERNMRAAKDDARARSLLSFGLRPFLNTWYSGDMWQSFREHPNYKEIVTNRLRHDDVQGLAKSLSDLSVGRQPSLWEDLTHCKIPISFIVGEKDAKFKTISRDICKRISRDVQHEAIEVPGCGHAVHLENPLALVRLVRQFLTKTTHS